MSEPGEEQNPKPYTPVAGSPPGPGAQRSSGASEKPGKRVYLLDSMPVGDLARALGLKPFQVVADLMQMKQFKKPDEEIDFETACRIARQHGFRPERPPPGMLVL